MEAWACQAPVQEIRRGIMYKEYLIIGGILLLAIIIVVSIIKKAIKLAIAVVAIILLFSLYNIFVKGVSPVDELNAYKTNIRYGRDISRYTVKVNTSVSNIRDILENKKTDETSIKALKEENERLKKYRAEVRELEHTERLRFFHDRYCGYLDTIVATTESAAKLSFTGNNAYQGAEEVLNNLKSGLENLRSLKIK
jgi:hypothetical protein